MVVLVVVVVVATSMTPLEGGGFGVGACLVTFGLL
jgi:hypothetical protein